MDTEVISRRGGQRREGRAMRIGIVAHNAYGSISGRAGGHVGGVERQMAMLARWLVCRGHEVSLITWREGENGDETIDGVRVLKACSRSDGVPVLRFFTPRWTSLNRALKLADAELYIHNGAEYVTGQVAMWCRRFKRRFVFSSASDYDCDRDVSTCRSFRERFLYRYGLRHADRIIVQTEGQAEDMLRFRNLTSTVLPMPCESWESGSADKHGGDSHPSTVLLVGRISPEKNVEMFIELARQMPELDFLVVGPTPSGNDYVEQVVEAAADVGNVKFFGVADRKQLGELYPSALALCNTSHFEGFPNTFIEAWSFGLPVISRIDPGGVIEKHGLGARAEDLAAMKRRLAEMAESPQVRTAAGERAREYFRQNHELDAAMARFEDLFLETV